MCFMKDEAQQQTPSQHLQNYQGGPLVSSGALLKDSSESQVPKRQLELPQNFVVSGTSIH